ncbi:MAG: DM13 domain-containing protein [Gemmatimonadaceae bacterium]
MTRYRAVSVWCRRFGVNFTTAELTTGTEKPS